MCHRAFSWAQINTPRLRMACGVRQVIPKVGVIHISLITTRWCPPSDVCWFIIPLTIDISTISPSY